MKKHLTRILAFIFVSLTCSCGSLDQWAQGMEAFSNGLSGTYTPGSTRTYQTAPTYNSTSSSKKEWHNCSVCGGTGKCKTCGGSGVNEYAKNKRCGVCRGTGKCAGCKGRGGWYI